MKVKFCLLCEMTGKPRKVPQGSLTGELLVWSLAIALVVVALPIGGVMFLIAAGYSAWRLCTKRPQCRECGSMQVVSIQSPAARRLMQRQLTAKS